MNKYPMLFAPQHWSPALTPWLVRCLRPLRRRRYRETMRLNPVQVTGANHLQQALADGQSVMISPNHPSHADPFAIYEACDQVGTTCHIMAAWHVFAKNSSIMQRCLQWHGCFSIDREANDLTAFREAVGILTQRREPLVIFPEGDIYHCNDRLTPLREGACAIAIAAAKRAQRTVAIIPTAIRYRCADDPLPSIKKVLAQIEQRLLWRVHEHLTPIERILNIGNAVLSLKELEFYGHSRQGSLPDRIQQLCHFLLERNEKQHAIAAADSVPKRVKQLRQFILSRLNDRQVPAEAKQQLRTGLDEMFLALQLFSYPGDYLTGSGVSIERIAETVDKLEEDVLQVSTASIRGRRDVQVSFGEPVQVPVKPARTATVDLTNLLTSRVTELLDKSLHTGQEQFRYAEIA